VQAVLTHQPLDATPADLLAGTLEDERLLGVIRDLHERNYLAYGSRWMWKALLRASLSTPPFACGSFGSQKYQSTIGCPQNAA